jgi:diadenosine tetraphosphate (Ap4A) HIT family hydrolase
MLVIPKREVSFPTGLTAAELDELTRVAQALSEACGQVAGVAPSKIWINPPIRLTVKQLHTHVVPPLDLVELLTAQPEFYNEVSEWLAARLGPSTPPAGSPPVPAGTSELSGPAR